MLIPMEKNIIVFLLMVKIFVTTTPLELPISSNHRHLIATTAIGNNGNHYFECCPIVLLEFGVGCSEAPVVKSNLAEAQGIQGIQAIMRRLSLWFLHMQWKAGNLGVDR
jgi:hypothetical protein